LGSKNRRLRKEMTQRKPTENMEQYTKTPHKKGHVERSQVSCLKTGLHGGLSAKP
jgi:hypothetical protein